jgi:glycosyltransferase involved in cell wall biosynthesis
MSHIGIDCRFASGHSGIGRYTREIVLSLLNLSSDHRFTLFVLSKNEEWLLGLPGKFTVVEATMRHYSLAEQLRLPRIIEDAGIDLFFSPHFNVPLRCPVPFVVTIHDLILHRYPNQASFLKQRAYRFLMKQSVRKAKHIIAVSAFTAQELLDVYGDIAQSKTTVIHEGISPDFFPRSKEDQQVVRDMYDLKQDYFLYVGNAKEHKNVQLLIDAYAHAHPSETELILVSGGKEATDLLLPSGVRCLDSVPEEHLPALYSAAVALVTASLYEGYCFPVLEAAACGSAIIATNGSAIAEVAPQGALLVEPTVDAFIQAFSQPPEPVNATDTPLWDEAATETLSVLQRACS